MMETFDKKGLSAGFKKLEEERQKLKEFEAILQNSIDNAERAKKEFLEQREATEASTKQNEALNKELSEKIVSLDREKSYLDALVLQKENEVMVYRARSDKAHNEIQLLRLAEIDNKEIRSKYKRLILNSEELQKQLESMVSEYNSKLKSLDSELLNIEEREKYCQKRIKEAEDKETSVANVAKSLEKEQEKIRDEWTRINKTIRDRIKK